MTVAGRAGLSSIAWLVGTTTDDTGQGPKLTWVDPGPGRRPSVP
jgi:hypothetical protein